MKEQEFRSEEAKSWRALYKTAQWLKLRAWHLSHNPLCVFCQQEGIATGATIVDHIKPHKGDRALFFDSKNLQSLCKLHHDRDKQKMERHDSKPQIGLDGWPI